MSTRPTRIGSTDLLEMEGGNLPSPKNQTSGLVSLFSTKNGEAHSTKSAAQQPPSVNALQYKSVSMDTAMVLQNKYRSWSRHLTLYCILGNLGMLLTVTSDNESGALSRVFCIGTYGHVFMEGSILLRLLFPPSQNYKLQMMHNYWGICTLLALIFFGNTFGELLWAAESILTDSMSLLLGAWLIQADVAPQVKLIGLSHFIHGITFEFFLWFDIAALSATYTATRGVFWVILVVANAVSQVIFHGPVIQGDFAASNKAQTPPPQSRRNLVCLWLCHNIFSIPLVLMFSTLGENHFYLEETHILPIYQVMIYTIPLPGLMIILYIFLRSKHAPYVSLAEENGIDHIDKPVEYEVHQGARVPQTRPPQRETIEAVRVLGNVFSSVSGTMLHSVFQLLLGTAFGVMPLSPFTASGKPLLPTYLALPLSIPMVLAGSLAIGKATGSISRTVWNRIGGPIFFLSTLLSMFSISGIGIGYWSAWGVLQNNNVVPAFLIIISTVYTAWSAWIMMHQAAYTLRGCFIKDN